MHGFPVELRQVFLNLISNAIQAIPDSGRLMLTVREAYDWTLMRRGISVSIVDTGSGVKPQDSKRLFEPFFSTKSTKGTGLGLWISKGIIQKYEGRISFRSLRTLDGCATCFRVFVPTSGTFNLGSNAPGELATGVEAGSNRYAAAMAPRMTEGPHSTLSLQTRETRYPEFAPKLRAEQAVQQWHWESRRFFDGELLRDSFWGEPNATFRTTLVCARFSSDCGLHGEGRGARQGSLAERSAHAGND